MAQTLASHHRMRILVSLLLALQGVASLMLAVFVLVIGIGGATNAVAAQKPTAAALSTAFAIVGGGLLIIIGLLVFLLASWLWRRKNWVFWYIVLFQGFALLFCLLLLAGGFIWWAISLGILSVLILLFVNGTRDKRANRPSI